MRIQARSDTLIRLSSSLWFYLIWKWESSCCNFSYWQMQKCRLFDFTQYNIPQVRKRWAWNFHCKNSLHILRTKKLKGESCSLSLKWQKTINEIQIMLQLILKWKIHCVHIYRYWCPYICLIVFELFLQKNTFSPILLHMFCWYLKKPRTIGTRLKEKNAKMISMTGSLSTLKIWQLVMINNGD